MTVTVFGCDLNISRIHIRDGKPSETGNSSQDGKLRGVTSFLSRFIRLTFPAKPTEKLDEKLVSDENPS